MIKCPHDTNKPDNTATGKDACLTKQDRLSCHAPAMPNGYDATTNSGYEHTRLTGIDGALL